MGKIFTIIKVIFGSIFKKPFMTNPDLAKAEVDKQIEKDRQYLQSLYIESARTDKNITKYKEAIKTEERKLKDAEIIAAADNSDEEKILNAFNIKKCLDNSKAMYKNYESFKNQITKRISEVTIKISSLELQKSQIVTSMSANNFNLSKFNMDKFIEELDSNTEGIARFQKETGIDDSQFESEYQEYKSSFKKES